MEGHGTDGRWLEKGPAIRVIETQHFRVSRVRFLYQESAEIRPDRSPPERIVVGVHSASVQCKSCGRQATTYNIGGGLAASCAPCGADETITSEQLRAAD